jgi:hypothetical protein
VPCAKTLDCLYFNKIFSNKHSNENLDVLDKQQYYINSSHKFYEECLEILHLECLSHIRCPICKVKQQINYATHTRWIMNMSISQDMEMYNFQEFHDIYDGL